MYLTAREAAEALSITVPTLYAYTSRGQLRSEEVPGTPRQRRYRREDIDRLLERKEARRDPSKAAARGLHWGSPVLESKITLIENGRHYYRGIDALKLAETATLEEVAELLWGAGRLAAPWPVTGRRELARMRGWSPDPLVRLQMALPLAGAVDPAAYDARPDAVRRAGARILRLASVAIAGEESDGAAHEVLARAWAKGSNPAAEAIRKALVLCADHELNVSAFTARCAASAGSSVYDVVSAGLAALKGSRHGGESRRVAALFEETRNGKRPRGVLQDRLKRDERLPGFGHPLYPEGDPRAEMLLRVAKEGHTGEEWRLAQALARAGRQILHNSPNLDFGLVALARCFGLPDHAPIAIFALGRTAGWIAHALEEYSTGEMTRPRAEYRGPAPSVVAARR